MKAVKHIYFPPFCFEGGIEGHLKKAKKGIRTGTIELNVDDKKLRIWMIDEWKEIGFFPEIDTEKIIEINKFSNERRR